VDPNMPPSDYDGYSQVPPAPVDAPWASPAASVSPVELAQPVSFGVPAPVPSFAPEASHYALPEAPPAYTLTEPVAADPYAVPQYAAPQYETPQYETPQYETPQYASPQYAPESSPLMAAALQAAEPAPVSFGSSVLTPQMPVADPGQPQPAAHVPAQATSEPDLESAVRLGAEDTSSDSMLLTDLLLETLDRGASDLHLTVGAHPTIRLTGQLTPIEERAKLTPQQMQKILYAVMSQKQREKFEEELELDFAYSVPGRARFRVNIYRQRDALGAAFRLIPYEIKPLEALGVPPAVSNFAMLPRGFVLVTGPTGSGKSTTLAAIVDLANRNRRDHIMTVEDPIEFLHEHKSCLVNQREVGEDTHNFKNALKHVLRQDPDIILVGEMRDLETIEIALTAAETGHLVMATLHTQDAAQTIDRVIDVFPPHQQQQVRTQLAGAIQGVVCQQLVRTADGRGRVVATEILIATPAIRNLIREGKTHQIYSAMQAGAKFGMATMDQHLADLVKKGVITYDAAIEKCHHIEDFKRLSGRM